MTNQPPTNDAFLIPTATQIYSVSRREHRYLDCILDDPTDRIPSFSVCTL